jgi:ATP synthase protein I
MLEAVARRQARKARSRREERPGLARGLGASGMIGWSIAVPTLVGVALGAWLDGRADAGFSWTLTLMAVGLLGFMAARPLATRAFAGPPRPRAEAAPRTRASPAGVPP